MYVEKQIEPSGMFQASDDFFTYLTKNVKKNIEDSITLIFLSPKRWMTK